MDEGICGCKGVLQLEVGVAHGDVAVRQGLGLWGGRVVGMSEEEVVCVVGEAGG